MRIYSCSLTTDHDEDDNGRQHKQKYRYRWPDEVRDEVLARLLELNRERALEEGQTGWTAKIGNDVTGREI